MKDFDFMYEPGEIRRRLGKRVVELRNQHGWTQEELAYTTGMGRSFTSAIETGKKDIRLSTVVKLANVFEVHIAQLFEEQPG
ncbi:MAG TPA: helix-turn-helix transcriptional regulator [Candidatus Angelobacter sp.]|nr:helix-turn-helix transcriptional regulator [Candidatus Angelobacter sp.]